MRLKDDYATREARATELAKRTWEEEPCVEAVIAALTNALREADCYTAEHSEETVWLAVRVARQLGLDDQEIALVGQVAALHDIGKIGVPVELLLKPGPLTDAERATMQTHPVIGERILAVIPELAPLARAVRHEHERWDGGGYPDGLAGEQIPRASRIVFACDAWHAMISDRPYQPACAPSFAMSELYEHSGTQFDPLVTQTLLAILEREVLQAA